MLKYLLLLLPLLFGGMSLGATPAVHEFKLDNGLKLIVKQDHRAPVYRLRRWYWHPIPLAEILH